MKLEFKAQVEFQYVEMGSIAVGVSLNEIMEREKSGHVEDMANRKQGLYKEHVIWGQIVGILKHCDKKFQLL